MRDSPVNELMGLVPTVSQRHEFLFRLTGEKAIGVSQGSPRGKLPVHTQTGDNTNSSWDDLTPLTPFAQTARCTLIRAPSQVP